MEEMVKEREVNKLWDVTLVRCFAVFSLVVWHTYCIYMCWGDVINCPLDWTYIKIMDRIIPHANMPLFTFIAGYLMGYQLENNKYEQFALFVKKKARRLLVPYILFGALMIIAQPGLGEWRNLLYGNGLLRLSPRPCSTCVATCGDFSTGRSRTKADPSLKTVLRRRTIPPSWQ